MAGPASTARTPSGLVLLNGTSVPWEELSVTTNGFYQSDKFEITIPVGGLPSGLQRADLSGVADIEVEIRMGLDGPASTSLIMGRVDEVTDDYVGGTITFSGRDHTADLIDTKTITKYQNLTASQIVQKLATEHGLTADVTATTTKSGKFYEIDHDRLTNDSTEWDLIAFLSQQEGYNAWVTGKVIHFHPASAVTSDPFLLAYVPATADNIASGNFTRLTTKRNLTLANDIIVKVHSWNHKQKKGFTETAKSAKTKGNARSGGQTQTYSFTIPGLDKAAALREANRRMEDISRHERILDVTMPGELTLTAQSQIKLSGTQTDFDQTFWIDEIERRLSMSEGFEMSVRAKNHSPQSTVTL